jgi:DNA replication and repair protein RecF
VPHRGASEQDERGALAEEVASALPRERAAGRSLAGPHRDVVELRLERRDVAEGASSGQARSLLLALALASLRVYREETGRAAVALLDDLDSELDVERAGALCAEVARRGQALVTSAHPAWAESLRPLGRIYNVSEGRVRCA